MGNILIIDDDDLVRSAIGQNLRNRGFSVVEAAGGPAGIKIFRKERPVSVLLDLRMPELDGITVLQELKKINPGVPVIIITAHGDIESAVEAIKIGAYDFIVKPPDFDRLALTLNRASEKSGLEKKIEDLKGEIETSLEYMLGKCDIMKGVLQQIIQVAQSDFSLIIQGETGTGKSFIARTIHNLGSRAKGPFVTVDIGALPETLVESELFGYEKGAFTGAQKRKKGLFEIAGGGTILIDELQNLTSYAQSKLLMVVEEKRFSPLGATAPLKSDVRIIAASNTDILKAVKEKKFREDLFYRLSEFVILLPPLRERPEDIGFLAEKFCLEAAEDLDKKVISISRESLNIIKTYPWPGNIRELKNVMRRAVLLSDDGTIKPGNLEFLIKDTAAPPGIKDADIGDFPTLNLSDLEKMAIRKSLEVTHGNKSRAASMLRIDYTTLLRKIKQYGI